MFDAVWSADTHPTDFPDNAHFSGLIGAVHDESIDIWQPGRHRGSVLRIAPNAGEGHFNEGLGLSGRHVAGCGAVLCLGAGTPKVRVNAVGSARARARRPCVWGHRTASSCDDEFAHLIGIAVCLHMNPTIQLRFRAPSTITR